MKILVLLLLISFLAANLYSQKGRCGNEFLLGINSPHDIKSRNDLGVTNSRTIITIPIVIHNIWNNSSEIISNQKILSQIENLNKDFSGLNNDTTLLPIEFKKLFGSPLIKFCIASRQENGIIQSGIIKKNTYINEIGLTQSLYKNEQGGSEPWDQKKYLNIWVANIGKSIQGFSSYPWKSDSINDGVIISSKYFGSDDSDHSILGRVLTHEIGHYFGLLHLWGSDSDCIDGDGIGDTPIQRGPHFGCPEYPQSGCDSSEMFMNFMDYTDDQCMFMFTKDQARRMIENILIYRKELLEYNGSCNFSNTELQDNFIFYPNPTHDELTLEFNNSSAKKLKIFLFNILGQEILNKEQIIRDKFTINLSEFKNGIIFIKVNNRLIKVIKS